MSDFVVEMIKQLRDLARKRNSVEAGEAAIAWPLSNVWLGVSVENQEAADERIPLLLQAPAAIRFLSCEPLLGPIDLSPWFQMLDRDAAGLSDDPLAASMLQSAMFDGRAEAPTIGERLHWVIAGGESGHGARSMDLAWARSLVAQCQSAGVSPFVKQLGTCPVCANDDARRWPSESMPLRWDYEPHHQGEIAPLHLNDRKGGDMCEWPLDLRVREFPEVRHANV